MAYYKEMEEWLVNLKVGDEVAIKSGYYGEYRYRIGVIEKITPTRQIKLVGSNIRYKNGEMIGKKGVFDYRDNLVPISEEIKNILLKEKLVSKISKVKFNEFSTEKLQKVLAILEE